MDFRRVCLHGGMVRIRTCCRFCVASSHACVTAPVFGVIGAHPDRYDPFVADRGPIVTEIKRAGVFWPAEVRGKEWEEGTLGGEMRVAVCVYVWV
jgi:hypothetical protein